MYRPSSFNQQELGDVEVIYHNDTIHLFHLCLPSHDKVAHLISTDGIRWKELEPAIATGNPGEFDDDMIWTMGITKYKDKFYMHYTGLSSTESGRVQRTGLAVSDDLIHWRKVSNKPVIAPAKPYERKLRERQVAVSWRDPKIYYENGRFYCLICAREDAGPFLYRGSAGLGISDDLIHWKIEKPILAPREYYDLECPQLIKIGKWYYILAGIMEDSTQRYWLAKTLKGPYHTPLNNLLAPKGHYAGKICKVGNEWWYFCWHAIISDGPDPAGNYLPENTYTRYIPTPLIVNQRPDGTLFLSSNPNWTKFYQKKISLKFQLQKVLKNAHSVVKTDSQNVTLSSSVGREMVLSRSALKNFSFQAKMHINATKAGIGFHIDPGQADGYFIEICPSTNQIKLVKHLLTIRNDRNYWFNYEVLQEAFYKFNSDTPTFEFHLQVVDGEIEFSINRQVIISKISFARQVGKLGFWVTSGKAKINSPTLHSIRSPLSNS